MIKLRSYGDIVEITSYEKKPKPKTLQISSSRKSSLFCKARRSDSVRRTRAIALRRLLSALKELGSPLFVTLTFEGSASDIFYASRSFSRFQRRLSSEFEGVSSLFVPELSPRGRIHFHGFVFGVSQEWGDYKKGSRVVSYGRERSERLFAKLWGRGFVDVRRTDGASKLAYYLVKYILKAGDNDFFSPIRLVRCSRNFPRPVELSLDDLSFSYLFKKMSLKKTSSFSSYTPFFGRIEKTYFEKI